MMMVAMKRIYNFSCSFTFGHPMEDITMSDIFKKRPEKHTAEKSQYNSHSRIIKRVAAIIKHIYNNRQINSPNDQRVCFGQHFKILILKKPGLPLIINFFELHAAKITRK